jgi:signal transduction histidine kinase
MINFKQKKAIDSVARNLDYLTATVKKFLNLGRIEKGEMSVHKSDIQLKKEIFDIAVNSLAAPAAIKNLVITNKIGSASRVHADSDLMQVVANNLIGNAIKYTPDGGQIILTDSVNCKNVKVEIYNDSKPITPDEAEKLFKKFSRLDRIDHKKVKGTGLGLYITKQIIESHGGKIAVEPREKGNSFIFEIERSLDNANAS